MIWDTPHNNVSSNETYFIHKKTVNQYTFMIYYEVIKVNGQIDPVTNKYVIVNGNFNMRQIEVHDIGIFFKLDYDVMSLTLFYVHFYKLKNF